MADAVNQEPIKGSWGAFFGTYSVLAIPNSIPAISKFHKHHENKTFFGEPCWVRTSDLLIKSQLLYRLS